MDHSSLYIRVKLLNGYQKNLTYQVPKDWPTEQLLGALVEVPLQKRRETARVEEIITTLDSSVTYTIRPALSLIALPQDPHYFQFIEKLSRYYAIDQHHFLRRLRQFLSEKERDEEIISQQAIPQDACVELTPEQKSIVDSLTAAIDEGIFYPALLHGVTGSGKTEIYKKLITHGHHQGKSTLLLLPEVSLAVQFAHILKKQLPPHIPLFSFHSATSPKEKRALWQSLLMKQPVVIIGVHLPALLPIPALGAIIIDEEHDPGFQEKKHPKINTKEAAIMRAQLSSIPLLAGSATPSIASLYNVEHRGWHFFELKKRFSGAFPRVEVVKLTDQKYRKHFWVSDQLEKAIKQQLSKGEQTIIFINRRGYSFFIQCTSCGSIPHCAQCSVSLTLHNDDSLRCHYCSFCIKAPSACAGCKATTFLKKGIGTQQVVSVLEKIFPEARIARADLDTTINKKKWRQTMQEFEEGKIDILVGTQTITKGYHFPMVTLVGILWADINLGLPFYNAAEVSLQQLIQVSGRAGRQSPDSRVIVQTMINHPIFSYLNEADYSSYYALEIKNRALVLYPPCMRFAEIELKHDTEAQVIADAANIAKMLKKTVGAQSAITVLGPSQPPVHMIKNVYSRKIYLKAASIGSLIDLYKSIDGASLKSSIFFTPNPLS